MFDLPADEIVDLRRAALRGLRELADFLEDHPDLPLPSLSTFSPYLGGGTDQQEWDLVDRVARILEVRPTRNGTHYSAARHFGPIEYAAISITDEPRPHHGEPETGGHLDPSSFPGYPEETRESVANGMRELADFLEAHPGVPAPFASMAMPTAARGTDEHLRAELDRIARILGVAVTSSATGLHVASRSFGEVGNPGSVEYYASVTTAPDEDFEEKAREAELQGLYELADFLEAHPDLPPPSGDDGISVIVKAETGEGEKAEVDRIARVLGVEATAPDGGRYVASRPFGAITYAAVALDREGMARYEAWVTYSDSVTPDESVATVTGDRAAPSERDRRAAVEGLRELAGFLRAHPDLPGPGRTWLRPHIDGATDEQERAEVDRIARILDVRVGNFPRDIYSASRAFGTVEYAAIAITRKRRARGEAARTYRDAVDPTPPEQGLS